MKKLFFIQNIDDSDIKAAYEGETPTEALEIAISHTMLHDEDEKVEKVFELRKGVYELTTTTCIWTVLEMKVNNWI